MCCRTSNQLKTPCRKRCDPPRVERSPWKASRRATTTSTPSLCPWCWNTTTPPRWPPCLRRDSPLPSPTEPPAASSWRCPRNEQFLLGNKTQSGGRRGFQPPHNANRIKVGFSPGGLLFGLHVRRTSFFRSSPRLRLHAALGQSPSPPTGTSLPHRRHGCERGHRRSRPAGHGIRALRFRPPHHRVSRVRQRRSICSEGSRCG